MASFKIHFPPLVFDEVQRRTGSIVKHCIFENRNPDRLCLRTGFDFPEHSWVQLYGADSRDGFSEGTLELEPGSNRLVLAFNTDSFNFPEGPFTGRIQFDDPAEAGSRQWIEIHFERVVELEAFRGYAAIDLGTCTSTVALYHIRKDATRRLPWSPWTDGRGESIPSAVFIQDFSKFQRRIESGSLAGQEAIDAYHSGEPSDPRCLQLSTKQLIGESRVLATDSRGTGGFIDPVDILEVLGKHVRRKTQNHAGVRSRLDRVSISFPPTWGYGQIARWKDVFKRLGFREDQIDPSLDEASAAGLFYIYKHVREPDERKKLVQDLLETEEEIVDNERRGKAYTLHLLSFDFGGGTTDLALIEARLEFFDRLFRLRLSLLGSDSLEFGGDQVTLAIFRILKRRLAMSLCNPSRMGATLHGAEEETASVLGGQSVAPETWTARRSGIRPDNLLVLPDGPTGRAIGMSHAGSGHAWSEASEKRVEDNWGYLQTHIAAGELDSFLEDAVEEIFPTRFLPSEDEPFRIDARRNFDWLWEQSEELKKRLFNELARQREREHFPSFEGLESVHAAISFDEFPQPALREAAPWGSHDLWEKGVAVSAQEVWHAVGDELREAVDRARRLVDRRRVDRVVLSGQSSRIPFIRWLFSMPNEQGGLGIPPEKVEFDAANAKTAVAKGACLLQVMRNTLVGFQVDIADFKANLLADIFYEEADRSRRVLFSAGLVDDFAYVEETPEPAAFPKYLSLFYGSEDQLIGQFLFAEDGEELPSPPDSEVPSHAELLELRERDRSSYVKEAAKPLQWPDRDRIAWMEVGASPGSPGRPVYRYYMPRSHGLYAVRDRGEEGKRLFALRQEWTGYTSPTRHRNPFSGTH